MGNSSSLSLVLGLFLLSAAPAVAEPPDVLVLRNGGTLVGRVTRDGESYVLRTLTGTGESRYPASVVAKACKGPREAYEFLKPSILSDEPLDHCRLARFCLTHDLLDETRAEIAAALKLAPRCGE